MFLNRSRVRALGRIILVNFVGLAIWRGGAQAAEHFSFRATKEAFSRLKLSPNVKSFVDHGVLFELLTEHSIEASTGAVSIPDTHGSLKGVYKSPDSPVSLDLKAKVEQGQLSTDVSLALVNIVLQEWKRIYVPPPGLQAYSPKFRELVFAEGEPLEFSCFLTGRHEYIFACKIPYADSLRIEDLTPFFQQTARFLKSVEGDKRSLIILANNKSQHSPFITFDKINAQQARFILHHPMHTVSRVQGSDELEYEYIDDLLDVEGMPEVRRIKKNRTFREFIKQEEGRVRVNMKGNEKTGFKFSLAGSKSDQRLEGTIVGSNVSLTKTP